MSATACGSIYFYGVWRRGKAVWGQGVGKSEKILCRGRSPAQDSRGENLALRGHHFSKSFWVLNQSNSTEKRFSYSPKSSLRLEPNIFCVLFRLNFFYSAFRPIRTKTGTFWHTFSARFSLSETKRSTRSGGHKWKTNPQRPPTERRSETVFLDAAVDLVAERQHVVVNG